AGEDAVLLQAFLQAGRFDGSLPCGGGRITDPHFAVLGSAVHARDAGVARGSGARGASEYRGHQGQLGGRAAARGGYCGRAERVPGTYGVGCGCVSGAGHRRAGSDSGAGERAAGKMHRVVRALPEGTTGRGPRPAKPVSACITPDCFGRRYRGREVRDGPSRVLRRGTAFTSSAVARGAETANPRGACGTGACGGPGLVRAVPGKTVTS